MLPSTLLLHAFLIPKYSFIDILKIVEAFDVWYFVIISGNVNIIATKAGLDIFPSLMIKVLGQILSFAHWYILNIRDSFRYRKYHLIRAWHPDCPTLPWLRDLIPSFPARPEFLRQRRSGPGQVPRTSVNQSDPTTTCSSSSILTMILYKPEGALMNWICRSTPKIVSKKEFKKLESLVIAGPPDVKRSTLPMVYAFHKEWWLDWILCIHNSINLKIEQF